MNPEILATIVRYLPLIIPWAEEEYRRRHAKPAKKARKRHVKAKRRTYR